MDSSDSYINKGSNNKHMVNASSIIPEMERKFPSSIPPETFGVKHFDNHC